MHTATVGLTIIIRSRVSATGASTKSADEGRIPFLARVRNKVLEPLQWPKHVTREEIQEPEDIQSSSSGTIVYTSIPGKPVGKPDSLSNSSVYSSVPRSSSGNDRTSNNDHNGSSSNHSSSKHSSSSSISSSSSSRLDSDRWLFRADKVVFLNDVYFCAQHIHRLLAHEGINLACGLDYYRAKNYLKLPASWRVNMWGMQVCSTANSSIKCCGHGAAIAKTVNRFQSIALIPADQTMHIACASCWPK